MGKGTIKYRFCLKDDGELIDINDLTPETKRDYNYSCISCGNKMIANIGKIKVPYFSHAADCSCNSESYLHKLSKRLIKQKFDEGKSFNIGYDIITICSQENCKYKDIYCDKDEEKVYNLKECYDTCTEEVPIKGFVADLLLSNSKKPEIEPILIEIDVSHPCEEEKRNSNLKIIELKINNEKDIIQLKDAEVIKETEPNEKVKNKIEFISFEHTIEKQLTKTIKRYISLRSNKYPYSCLLDIDCTDAGHRLRNDSVWEFNYVKPFGIPEHYMFEIDMMLYDRRHIRSCTACKYRSNYEHNRNPKIVCHMRKKYGSPVLPTLQELERCKYFSPKEIKLLPYTNYIDRLEEVTKINPSLRPHFKVMLVISNRFNNYDLFKAKLNYRLSEKIKTHSVVFKYMETDKTKEYISKYTNETNISFICEPYTFNTYKNYFNDNVERIDIVNLISDEMMITANALMIFVDYESPMIKQTIEKAKKKDIPYVLVNDVYHSL